MSDFQNGFLVSTGIWQEERRLRALTRESLTRTENWGTVNLSPDIIVIASTELAESDAVTSELSLNTITEFLDPGHVMEEDRRLCSVRALRISVERTDNIRGNRMNLILSIRVVFPKT